MDGNGMLRRRHGATFGLLAEHTSAAQGVIRARGKNEDPSNDSESGNSTAAFEDDQGNQLEIQVDNPIDKPSTDLTAKDRTVSVEDVEASEEAKTRVLKWHILKPNQRTPQQICNEEYQVLEDYARMVRTFIAIATEIDHKKDKQRKPEDWYVVWRAFDALAGNCGQMANLVNQKSSLWGEALQKGWVNKVKELWPGSQPPERDN
ncbi:hypothetical protein OC845_000302 [Tilletia horrida]|nr:hypothetical protein OC845_000302 [Tilletia horrida]